MKMITHMAKMGNYSKTKVRELSGEAKKVKFLPLRKCDTKTVPLNMLSKITAKVTSDKSSQVSLIKREVRDGGLQKQGIGMYAGKGIGIYDGHFQDLGNKCGSDLECQCELTRSVPSGMHNCIGHDATCRGLSAGAFKAPGGCSKDKIEFSSVKVSPSEESKPLRNNTLPGTDVVKCLSLFFKEPSMKELNPAISKAEAGGWQRIKGVMDSGASESVAHPSMCPQYPVQPSAGSISGQKYVSASGDVIANIGEQILDVETDDGMATQIRYQSAEVSRPLNAVSEICDAGGVDGQYVVFSKYGGMIMNLETGRRTPFERVEGIYELGIWVKPPESSVFPRPGN